MKRSERHHLKENELAHSVARAREVLEQQRRPIFGTVAVAVVLAAVVGGFAIWRQQTNARASAMLAEAMVVSDAQVVAPAPAADPKTPPAPQPPNTYPTEKAKLESALSKFTAVADKYPRTHAGIGARYHEAATLAALGRSAEAERQYQQVIDRDGDGIYGRVARLGLAEVRVQAKRYDEAITIYKELSSSATKDFPADAVLIRLANAYAAAGRQADARQTLNRILSEFPTSPYSTDARQELDRLGGS
jgi:predicted negative regulator of RcsB-dependent stress response